jgi:hypothetical protein
MNFVMMCFCHDAFTWIINISSVIVVYHLHYPFIPLLLIHCMLYKTARTTIYIEVQTNIICIMKYCYIGWGRVCCVDALWPVFIRVYHSRRSFFILWCACGNINFTFWFLQSQVLLFIPIEGLNFFTFIFLIFN